MLTTDTILGTPSSLQKTRIIFWTLALFMGFLNAWAGRHVMNPDGITYLDIADAYLRGDWKSAIIGNWSPLYSWFLALGLALLQPTAFWEFAAVHLVNFLIYVAALFSFEFLLREIRYFYESSKYTQEGLRVLPAWTWYALGYALFIRASLGFTTLQLVAPDLATAALIYLSCALLIRFRRSRKHEIWTLYLLGLTLGLGYFSRSFFFPLAFIFFAAVFFISKNKVSTFLTAFVFFVVISPYVWALSRSENKPFAFMSGKKMEYLLLQEIFPGYASIPSEERAKYRHFPKKVNDNRFVFSFDGLPDLPKGTHPLTYNPSYLWEGYPATFNLETKVTSALSYIWACLDLLFKRTEILLVAILIFLGMSGGWKIYLKQWAERWDLWLPAFFCLTMFCLTHLEIRYTAPFFVLFWLSLFLGIRLPESETFEKLASQIMRAVVIIFMIQTVVSNRNAVNSLIQDGLRWKKGLSNHPQWMLAEDLKRHGLQAGDPVGIIGEHDLSWARLIRAQVMAEIPIPSRPFWTADPADKTAALQAFASAGVKAVVIKKFENFPPLPGSEPLAGNDYYVFFPQAGLK